MSLSKQNMAQTIFETDRIKSEMAQSKPALYAPDNLPLAAETFQLQTRLESHDFPADKMIRLKAWKELNTTLTGYAERIKTLEKNLALRNDFYSDQRNAYSRIGLQVSWDMLRMGYIRLACVIAILVFTVIRLRRKKEGGVEKA